jgi:hypothetical protein
MYVGVQKMETLPEMCASAQRKCTFMRNFSKITYCRFNINLFCKLHPMLNLPH